MPRSALWTVADQLADECRTSVVIGHRLSPVSCYNFLTASRAHLRRAGPHGPGREQRGRARAVEGMSGQGDPPWAARVHSGVSPLRGCSFRRVLRTQALRHVGAAHGIPGDRPPAVPAVSRCRARQHHGQAVTLAPIAGRREDVTTAGRERRALSGSAPPASTVLRIPLCGTRLRRAVDPGDLMPTQRA